MARRGFQWRSRFDAQHPVHNAYGITTALYSVQEGDTKVEYRAWNPFRSKLGAGILGGVSDIHMEPGSKVLYLGAASGTSVSHVSDIVGPVSTLPLPAFNLQPFTIACPIGPLHDDISLITVLLLTIMIETYF